MDLKNAIRRYAAGDVIGRDAVEHLRAAGLLSPVGYVITEMGRSLMLQNPSPMPGQRVGDVDEPAYDNVQTIKPVNLFGHSLAAGVIAEQANLNALAHAACGVLGNSPEKSAKDVQIGGDHYKKLGHHQPWEVLATWMTPEELRGHMKGTVIAYLAREQDKGGDTDVAKALHTMQLWQDVRKDK